MFSMRTRLRAGASLCAILPSALLATIPIAGESLAQVRMTIPVPAGSRVDHTMPMGNLGKSIRISGTTLIMGGGAVSPSTGAVLVFEEETPDNWVFKQRLDGATASEDTGITIAIDGDFIAIGSPAGDESISESVALYRRVGSTWEFDQQLSRGGGQSAFGRCVELDGTTLMIGAPLLGTEGRTLFYEYDGSDWIEVFSEAHPASTGSYTNLGVSLDLEGDVAVAGSPSHPTEQVVLYRRNSGVWAADDTLSLADWGTLAADGFTRAGERVALHGDTILVRVTEWPPVAGYRSAIAVLEDSGAGFEFTQLIEASDAVGGPEVFGADLALAGDLLVVGAPLDAPRGSAYVFRRELTGFVEEAKFIPTSGESSLVGGNLLSPQFGYSVSITGDKVAFGARLDSGFLPRQGAGYVFTNVMSSSVVQGFCFGDGGEKPGCTDCPCDNNADPGTVGGCLNSDQRSAVLAVTGEARVSNDTVRLEVARAKPNSLALLVSSESMLPRSLTVGGCPRGSGARSSSFNGLRCIGAPSLRHGVRTSDAQGTIGVTSPGWGGPFEPSAGLVVEGGFTVGQNRYFQVIYRDVAAAECGATLNTTNAVSAMILP